MGHGKRLKEFLKSQGISISTVADEMKLPKTTLYSIVNRDSNIKDESYTKIIEVISILTSTPARLIKLYLDGYITLDELEKERSQGYMSAYKSILLSSNGYLDTKQSGIFYHFDKLNDEGKIEAVKRVEELTQIPKYKK